MNVLTIVSHSQMFPFIAQHEEVKRSIKNAVGKGRKKKKGKDQEKHVRLQYYT